MAAEPSLLHDALHLLDAGGNAAICVGVDRVRARMMEWPGLRSAHPEDTRASAVHSFFHDDARSASLGMFAPLPDQVILNVLQRLHGKDLHK